MSQPRAVYQWMKEVARQMPGLRKSQAVVLAAFSWGVTVARRCTLRVVAEALPTAEYQGKTYYFCNEADKQAFSQDPERYAKGKSAE